MTDTLTTFGGRGVYYKGHFYSGEQLRTSIDKVALYMERHGHNTSPFVYLFAVSHPKTIVAFHAILRAGLVAVLVSPDIGRLELQEMVCDTPPRFRIHPDIDTHWFDCRREIAVSAVRADWEPRCDLSDVCVLAYTAAEDGHAKAAMLTYENMLANANAIVECDGIRESSVSCALLPLCALFGLQTGVLAPGVAGATAVLEDIGNLRAVKSIVERIERCGVTNIYSVPMVYYLLAKVPSVAAALSTVSSCVSGAYKLTSRVFESFRTATGKQIQEGYGLTEGAPICTWHRPGDVIRLDSVGRAFSCCEVAVLDEEGRACSSGEVGEVCVRGANVMRGYYGAEKATDAALRDGWLHTGDYGRIDEHGSVALTGLRKRMLNVGGRKVYPVELERLLQVHAGVAGVRIWGEATQIQGDKLCAEVELVGSQHATTDTLRKWCMENISPHKVPTFTAKHGLRPPVLRGAHSCHRVS